jgi:hypothetical protein
MWFHLFVTFAQAIEMLPNILSTTSTLPRYVYPTLIATRISRYLMTKLQGTGAIAMIP